MDAIREAGAWLGLLVVGALLSGFLIVILRPWLLRYALARPSARGLHRLPTPQGGGIAVLAACAVTAVAGAWLCGTDPARLTGVLVVAWALSIVGLVDDIRPLPPLPRLVLQLAAMMAGVLLLPDGTRVLPFLPPGVEAAILVVAGTWFINLTNFMDGMDWITVVDAVPAAALLAVFGAMGFVPAAPALLAFGLIAGLLGYAPFNRPPAKLFLGDVGSLPIGFLLAYALFGLAGHAGGGFGGFAAAVLLVLYPVADSTVTLLRRLARRERVWEPHRDHFYQRAALQGHAVPRVLGRIATANVVLAVLATGALRDGTPAGAVFASIAGAGTVALTLSWLTRRPRELVEEQPPSS